MTVSEEQRRLPESSRVEAFSDGVLAIAITLLVLELHVPVTRGEFLAGLAEEWQSYLAYLAAFLIIGTVWLTHHALFTKVVRVDNTLMRRNLALLLFASVLPFPTAILSSAFRYGDQNDQFVAIAVFASVSIALTLTWNSITLHVERSTHLLRSPEQQVGIRRDRYRQLAAVAPPLVGVAIALVSPITALLVQVATPALYLASMSRSDVSPLGDPQGADTEGGDNHEKD